MEKHSNLYGIHPGEILTTKKGLRWYLLFREFDFVYDLLYLLILEKEHPSFREQLMRVVFRMQVISSLVYAVRGMGQDRFGEPYVTKLPIKEYECLFDGYCETINECLERLQHIFREKGVDHNKLTQDFIKKIFVKYIAIKRYTIPMLGYHSCEYCHASFFEYVILYVIEHDIYPDFPINYGYRYPEMPGSSDWNIEDYC